MSVIVVGYSAKPEGAAALDRAIAEAELRDSSIIVVHTLSEDSEITDLAERLAQSGRQHQIRVAPDPLDPAEEVLASADRSNADFIVIGLRRRSPVGKLLLGSNAQRVLLDAQCPVMAVKADS
ncbi:universal stress protein [Propionibacteriaceae bacterium Y1685]|uniref:universal stress protein n=1 Tax=Microlunatus sp. Y1700 TaxID=3418487 RepID=UPI003B774292